MRPQLLSLSSKQRVFLTVSVAFSFLLLWQFGRVELFDSAQLVKAQTENLKQSDENVNEKPHNVVAAFYDVQNIPSARLLLNNKDIVAREVRPTLYNLDGLMMEVAPVWVEASSSRMIDLREWANLGGESFGRGSLRLFHTGKDLVIGSQVYLEDAVNSLSFEERLAELGKFDSRHLESVWWMPNNRAQVAIILSNTSEEMISVSATLSSKPHQTGEAQTFILLPHQTRVLDLRNDFADGNQFANAEVIGLSLEHTGGNSALKAHGQIKDAPKGYSNIISFNNPNSGKSSELHGTGLHLGTIGNEQIAPIVAVKNVGSEQANVTAKVPYTRTDGTTGTVNLNSINLQAGEMRLLNMNSVIQRSRHEQIKIAGIEVEYNTEAGSVIVQTQSVSNDRNQMFRVPMADPLSQVSSTGGYPWRIEETSRMVSYIKNMTDLEQEYFASLTWAGGGKYTIGLKKIAPHKTIEIDVKKLRDEQTPDFRGTTIPLNLTSGQIKWTLHKKYQTENPKNDEFALIGRSEQIDTINKTSSSYACQNCCSGGDIGGFISTDPLGTRPPGDDYEFEVGDTVQYYAFIISRDCFGYEDYCPYSANDWDSSNENTATIDSTGLVTIQNVGDVNIYADLTGYFSIEGIPCGGRPYLTEVCENQTEKEAAETKLAMLIPCGECESQPRYFDPDANIVVKPKVQIPLITAVPKGSNREIRIEVLNATNVLITLTLVTREGTGSARFSTGTNTITINNTQNVTIKGVTESSKKDNIRIKATWSNNNRTYTLKEEDFSVLWITLALRSSGEISSDNARRNVYNTAVGTTGLKTFQSSGTSSTLWRTGVEIVGTVLPSDFTDIIILKRQITGKKRFNDRTDNQITYTPDDTSEDILRDDDPQSGNSNGKVYDLDAPGIATAQARPIGYILRDRTNFRQYATFTENGQEMIVSDDLLWFSRISIQKTRRGDVLLEDVSGDNLAGTSTTNLTWNLEASPLAERSNEMKQVIPLIITLVMSQSINCPQIIGQTIQKQCQNNNQQEDVTKLLAVIRDKSLVENNPSKVIEAIDKLGKMKAVEAVDDLIELLTLDRGSEYFDTENLPSGGIITAYTIFPAVQALARIGERSLSALTKVIETEPSDSLASKNAWQVIFFIYNEDLPKASEALRSASSKAKNQEGVKRLLEAAQKFDDLENKLRKSN